MESAGQRLGLRLFLEGLEVPVISAQVQIGINAPATASIQVVPGDKITELKARTMVHLFFWDFTLDNEPAPVPPDPGRVAASYGITIDEAKQLIAENPDLFATDIQAELRGYKLLFSGEVIGFAHLKTPAGRQSVLQCSDFSTYWDTTYQFFVSYSPNGNFMGTNAAIWAGADSMFDDLTEGHVSVMNEYLNSKPQTPGLQGVKGLMGGIISLLEAMGGVPKHTHGVNDFFTIAELKNHLLQQLVAEQNDNTAQRLFDDKAFMDWLSRGMSSLGELSTFRDMMKLLFQYVYYEVVPNPAAMYVRAKQSQATTTRVTVTTKVELPQKVQHDIFVVAQDCDRFGVQEYNDPPFDEDKYAKSMKTKLRAIVSSAGMPALYRNKLEQVYPWLDKIMSTASDPRGTVSKQNPFLHEFDSPKFKNNRIYWKKASEILNGVLDTDLRFSNVVKKPSRTAPELDRLNTQIFRPDCFFAAAPRCNVLFPDQYTQFSFSRSFLQEVTRLRLHEEWEFGINEGLLETNIHFAPSLEDISKLAKNQGNGSVRALLPWEVYSGILPKFETVHEVNYVAGQGERRRGIKGNIKGAATDYTQRVANFNYIKYRFAARTCDVSGKFNPFLVCGFPGVLLNKPFFVEPDQADMVRQKVQAANPNLKGDDVSEFVKAAATELNAPTQYIGMIAAISHSVQQDGGSTSFVMTHARSHRITDDDFLNIFSTELSNQLTTSIVSTVLKAEDLIKNGDYRNLKFLIDATPQDLDVQAQTLQDVAESDDGIAIDDPVDVAGRPSGAPSSFGSLLSVDPPSKQVELNNISYKVRSSDVGTIPIRGRVKKDRLKNSRQTIYVPDPGGKLRVGAKGPKGGKIVQIQCITDGAMGLVGSDVARKINTSQVVTLASSTIDQFVRDPQTGKLQLKTNTIGTNKVTYLWKGIVIYEEASTTTKASKILPVEEGIRPPWFSPLYSNWFIGDEIYQPFFGTGSVVDQALFVSSAGSVSFGTGKAQQQAMLDKLKAAGNDKKQIMQIIADAKAKDIADVPDIESSVDVLAYLYAEVRRLGLDVHRFVNDYTHRPIASMEDMFGSDDLTYEVQGDILKLTSGTPGFHSTAIANVDQLRGLVDNPDLGLPRLKSGQGRKDPLSRDLDPRPGRRAKVVEYLQEINASSGSLGVGVQG